MDYRTGRSMMIRICVLALLLSGLASAGQALAKSAAEIDIGVQETLKQFRSEVKGGSKFLSRASGVLVFPSVIKAGFGIGGEYGEGALRVGGKTVDYYNTAAASIGFQIGAQSKSIVIVFMTSQALADSSSGAWAKISIAWISRTPWSASCSATRGSCTT